MRSNVSQEKLARESLVVISHRLVCRKKNSVLGAAGQGRNESAFYSIKSNKINETANEIVKNAPCRKESHLST